MLKKISKIHLLALLLVIILVAGALPTSYVWSLSNNSKTPFPSKDVQRLQAYQAPLQPNINTTQLPYLSANAFIVVDSLSNNIIIAKNPHLRIYPASTTKLATVLTALNTFSLDELITVKEPYTEGKIMELQEGEKITVKSLISALLVFSANDSAHALSNHYSQGSVAFINSMNELMKKYGLVETNFVNVDGIHDLSHYSTVSDLAQLGRLAIKNPIVVDTVKTQQITVTDTTGTIIHPLVTTNELLGVVPEVVGLKTGWTPEAGGCFIGLLNIDGHQIISVVAGSTDRFGDTKLIIDWLKKHLTYSS